MIYQKRKSLIGCDKCTELWKTETKASEGDYLKKIREQKKEIERLKNENGHKDKLLIDYKAAIKSVLEELKKTTATNKEKYDSTVAEIAKIKVTEYFDVQLENTNCVSDKDVYVDYICQVCMTFVNNPVSCSKCDNIYCDECIDKKIDKKCPNCRNHLTKASLPRLGMKTLNSLKFECPYDCKKIFTFEGKTKHFNQCANKKSIPTKCSFCKMDLDVNNENRINEHTKTCKALMFNCSFCQMLINKSYYKEHIRECRKFEIECKTCLLGYVSPYIAAHNDFYCKKISDLIRNLEKAGAPKLNFASLSRNNNIDIFGNLRYTS